MSLLLMMFYWLVTPGVGVVAAIWLWRSAKQRSTKILALIPIVSIFAWLAWTLYGGEKFLLDRQVQELCAKDGGVKIYETVKLSANRFDAYGDLRIPSKRDAKPEDDYYYEWNVDRYGDGNPSMRRDHFLVFRRSDSKLLGEAVSYARRGGDLPGPWHESSFRCPEQAGDVVLNRRIFVQSN